MTTSLENFFSLLGNNVSSTRPICEMKPSLVSPDNQFTLCVADRANHPSSIYQFMVEGLKCRIESVDFFNWSGCVLLPDEHPDNDNIRELSHYKVHRGINRLEKCFGSQSYWIGFTTNTINDYTLVRHICGNNETGKKYYSFAYVKSQTENLARQILRVQENYRQRKLAETFLQTMDTMVSMDRLATDIFGIFGSILGSRVNVSTRVPTSVSPVENVLKYTQNPTRVPFSMPPNIILHPTQERSQPIPIKVSSTNSCTDRTHRTDRTHYSDNSNSSVFGPWIYAHPQPTNCSMCRSEHRCEASSDCDSDRGSDSDYNNEFVRACDSEYKNEPILKPRKKSTSSSSLETSVSCSELPCGNMNQKLLDLLCGSNFDPEKFVTFVAKNLDKSDSSDNSRSEFSNCDTDRKSSKPAPSLHLRPVRKVVPSDSNCSCVSDNSNNTSNCSNCSNSSNMNDLCYHLLCPTSCCDSVLKYVGESDTDCSTDCSTDGATEQSKLGHAKTNNVKLCDESKPCASSLSSSVNSSVNSSTDSSTNSSSNVFGEPTCQEYPFFCQELMKMFGMNNTKNDANSQHNSTSPTNSTNSTASVGELNLGGLLDSNLKSFFDAVKKLQTGSGKPMYSQPKKDFSVSEVSEKESDYPDKDLYDELPELYTPTESSNDSNDSNNSNNSNGSNHSNCFNCSKSTDNLDKFVSDTKNNSVNSDTAEKSPTCQSVLDSNGDTVEIEDCGSDEECTYD